MCGKRSHERLRQMEKQINERQSDYSSAPRALPRSQRLEDVSRGLVIVLKARFGYSLSVFVNLSHKRRALLVAQRVKNPPTM